MMKWKNYGWLLITVLFVACGGDGSSEEDENRDGIKITGTITGAENQNVSLYVFEEDGNRLVDSSIVKDNSFTVWTETHEFREYILEFGSSNNSVVKVNNYIYLLPDEQSQIIEIEGAFPGIGDNYEISGCPNSSEFREYLLFSEPYYTQIEPIKTKYNSEIDTNVLNVYVAQMDSLKSFVTDYAIEYINEKPGSPVSWVMLKEFYPAVGIAGFDTTYFEYFDKVRDGLKEKYPYSYLSQYVEDTKKNTIAQLEELRVNPDGDLAPEIAMENPDGEILTLSSLRGNVVLIDFWASWCKPCRQENPNVVATYEKYKDKGFTVFSVSLDQNKDAWLKAIEADNLVWPNHVSDLKGWENEAARAYGVNSIPATFLLDRRGKIIDQNLRGGLLEQRLQEILG